MKKIELAGAILLDKNDKILLIHRNTKDLQQWELPGGKLEKNELPEQAVVRELKEELNVQVQTVKYIGFKEFEDNGIILKYHWYKCKIESGIPELMEEKFDSIKYFSNNELLESKELSSNMMQLISNINIDDI
jgi:8-oxo-dGTP diphosphatase